MQESEEAAAAAGGGGGAGGGDGEEAGASSGQVTAGVGRSDRQSHRRPRPRETDQWSKWSKPAWTAAIDGHGRSDARLRAHRSQTRNRGSPSFGLTLIKSGLALNLAPINPH